MSLKQVRMASGGKPAGGSSSGNKGGSKPAGGKGGKGK